MNTRTTRKTVFALLAAAAFFSGSTALADLMLHPHRVVLEGKERSAQIEIINRSGSANVYRLKLVRRRMSDLGEFVEVDEPLGGELFADDLIRYSPRQIELAPGASQTIRVMLHKPAGLAPGEYRSHLLFERLPSDHGSTGAGQSASGQGDVDIRLTALVSVSIPVIVRQGETAATVTLSNLRLESSRASEPVLAFTLQRSGNRSVYGDLIAEFVPKKGPARVVGAAKGVAVYAPNALRHGRMVLRPGGKLGAGALRVIYREQASGGGEQLAERVLQLP